MAKYHSTSIDSHLQADVESIKESGKTGDNLFSLTQDTISESLPSENTETPTSETEIECLVTKDAIVYRKINKIRSLGESFSHGPGSEHGEYNVYRKINKKYVELLPNYNPDEKFLLNFINEKTRPDGTVLIKGYLWLDALNLSFNLNLTDIIYPIYTGFYLLGPTDIIDLYYTIKNKNRYKEWEKSFKLTPLKLPKGFFEYGYCVRVDKNSGKILLYKRYGSSEKKPPAHKNFVVLIDGSVLNFEKPDNHNQNFL